MSKKKHALKETEKLLRAGRYWDLLRYLQSGDMVSANARMFEEAWKGAVKQALRYEWAFHRFCGEVETLKPPPATPDFHLLLRLKAFVEGEDTTTEILELKGLSPDAEALRSSFSTFASSFHENQKKLRDLLAKFIVKPETITRRYYEQLSGLIPAPDLKAGIERLGTCIARARQLNRKDAVARGWDGFDFDELGLMDGMVEESCKGMPEAFRHVLLHPFVHNIVVMLRRLAPQANTERASSFLQAIRFFKPFVAEGRLEEVERRLLVEHGGWAPESVHDLEELGRRMQGTSLEEKLTVLRGLRASALDLASRAPDFERPDFEDLDLFADSIEDMEDEEAESLNQAVLLLYRLSLGEISGRTAALSAREKKELVRVMEPLLLEDFRVILAGIEDADQVMQLLNSAIDAGCAGTRLAMLSLLTGARFRNSDLLKRADKLLDQTPTPTLDDIRWFAKDWSDLYYPHIRALKPLLRRHRGDPGLLLPLAQELCGMTEFTITESTLQGSLPALTGMSPRMLGLSKPKEPGILRRELLALTEYEALDPLREYLKCYPDDRFTTEGHLCWYSALHNRLEGGFWKYALDEFERYSAARTASRELAPMGILDPLFEDRIDAMWIFLQERPSELASLPTELLQQFLNGLLDHTVTLAAHHTFLIHMEKLLMARMEAGDKSVRPLTEKLRRTLLKLARRGKSPSRAKSAGTRKRRR